jgi:hypothetical protein
MISLSDLPIISKTEKEPSLRQALKYEKTDKYNNDQNYKELTPAYFYIRF